MTLIVFIGLRFHKRNRQVARAVPNWIFFLLLFNLIIPMPLLGLKTLKRGSPKYVTKFLFFFLQRVVRAAIKIERKTAPAAIGSAPAFALIDRIHLHRLAGLFLFNWVFTGFYRFFFCRRRVWLGARASIAVDFNLRRGWIHLHRLQ